MSSTQNKYYQSWVIDMTIPENVNHKSWVLSMNLP